MVEWSQMLPEVLDIIAERYIACYEDYPSFAGVCKSWRLAAARTYHNSNGPPSQFPSLMLEEKSDDHESRELFLLSNKSIRNIQLPEAYGKQCRSSCGWLLTIGEDIALKLINPLSREIINLPKLDTSMEAIRPSHYRTLQKVVVLMESRLVFVIWDDNNNLEYCHIGDNKWTLVNGSYYDFIDITFYNGQVYTLNRDDKIQACNVNGKDRAVLVDVTTTPEYDFYDYPAYIVELDDGERKQLLLIIKKEYKKTSFKVLAYDFETGYWSRVKDFCNKALFVGYTSSFWVEDTTGVVKGNCIYYTNGIRGDMGIYHLLDGTIETIKPHYFAGKPLTPPLWLQSM